MQAYRTWLKRHLREAEAEYSRIQKLEDRAEDDRELYEQVHQMWGYLAALEKSLKEFDLHTQPKAKTPPARRRKSTQA